MEGRSGGGLQKQENRKVINTDDRYFNGAGAYISICVLFILWSLILIEYICPFCNQAQIYFNVCSAIKSICKICKFMVDGKARTCYDEGRQVTTQ